MKHESIQHPNNEGYVSDIRNIGLELQEFFADSQMTCKGHSIWPLIPQYMMILMMS